MAKLSARGRTELARFERVRTFEPGARKDNIIWDRTTLAVMSDGTILEKRDAKYPPAIPGLSGDLKWGWRVSARRKKDATGTQAEWVENLEKILTGKGFTRIR